MRDRALAAGVLAALPLALAVGLAWELLAPTPVVELTGGQLVSPAEPEFAAAQDGTFALLAAAAGVLHAAVLLAVRATRLRSALGALAAAAAGSLLAWRLGVLLGPPPVDVQQEAGRAVLRPPLQLHAYGVLGVWPATLAAVLFAVLLATGLSAPGASAAGDRGDDGTGEPHQVGRRELDVQTPTARADEHGGPGDR